MPQVWATPLQVQQVAGRMQALLRSGTLQFTAIHCNAMRSDNLGLDIRLSPRVIEQLSKIHSQKYTLENTNIASRRRRALGFLRALDLIVF